MMLRVWMIISLASLSACYTPGRGIPAPIESRENPPVEVRREPPPIISSQPSAAPSDSPVYSGQVDRSTTGTIERSGDLGRRDDPVDPRQSGATTRPGTIQRRSIDTPAAPSVSPPPVASEPVRPTVPMPPTLPARQAEGPAASLLTSVDEAIAAGELERAAALCERALRISPRDGYLWYRLASIHYQQESYEEAIGFGHRALSFAGSDRMLSDAATTLVGMAEAAQQ